MWPRARAKAGQGADEFLLPAVRGLLYGDGSIVNVVHAPTKRLYPNYRYERLMAQFNSASRAHLEWLRARLEPTLRTRGYIEVTPPKPPRHEFNVYPDVTVPRLVRKWEIWERYRLRHCADGGT